MTAAGPYRVKLTVNGHGKRRWVVVDPGNPPGTGDRFYAPHRFRSERVAGWWCRWANWRWLRSDWTTS